MAAQDNAGNRAIVVAVCTRNRPELLSACLASVAVLRDPPGHDVEIVVVDNSEDADMQARNRRVVAAVATGRRVTIENEARLGIPHARNRAVEFATASGADALVFLDDDQTVPPDWLEAMAGVWHEEAADAVKSSVCWTFEGAGRYREYFEAMEPQTGADGRLRDLADLATNGVLIDRKLFADWGLRFDPAYGFMGCDDADYFIRSHDRGGRHVMTSETQACEFCPAGKQTLRWLLRREFRVGAGMAAIAARTRGRFGLFARGARRTLRYGIVALLLAPLPRAALRNLLRAARGGGLCWGALGRHIQEYRQVVGR